MSELARQILKDEGYAPPVTTNEGEGGAGNGGAPAAAPAGEGGAGGTNEPAPAKPGGEGNAPVIEDGGAAPAGGEKKEGDDANNSTEGDGKEKAKPKPVAAAPAKPKKEEKQEPAPLTDTALLEALKLHGIEAVSLDDLKPKPKPLSPEEQAAAEQKELNDAIAFGLSNSLFTNDDLTGYAKEKDRSVRDRALEVFANVVRKDEAELTDEEVEERFADYFGENLEEDAPRRRMMQAEMDRLADRSLKTKYAGIINSTDAYRAANAEKQEARQYRTLVENTFAALPPKMEFTVEGRTYHYTPQNDTLNTIKEQFLSQDSFDVFGRKAPEAKELAAAVNNALLAKDHTRAIEVIAKAHSDAMLLEQKGGRIGVVPVRDLNGHQQQDGGGTYQGFAKEILQSQKS